MASAAYIINELANTPGRNDKLALIRAYSDEEEFKAIMQFIYNPYHKTGISKAKLKKALDTVVKITDEPITTFEIIDYLKQHNTGTTADLLIVSAYVNQFEEGTIDRWVAEAIVTQDLKIGITATSLNVVYGRDFIPKTGCMLGTRFDDVRNVAWPCVVTEKLDGIRRVLIKENGVVRCFSRSGHEDTGMVEIVKEAAFLPDNYIYDGELIAAGTFKDNIAVRQATSSIANSGGNKKNLIFYVFDMVPVSQFYLGLSAETAIDRKLRLAATLDDQNSTYILDNENWAARVVTLRCSEDINIDMPHIKAIPILGLANSFDDVQPIVEKIWARHGEGVMLNVASGRYEIKRSKQLLKVKYIGEEVLPVVDFIEGNGKYADMLGAIVVMYRDNSVGVGSGFTDYQRKEIWENQDYYRGRYAEIDTFGESQNQLGEISLNCPIFKRWAQGSKDAAAQLGERLLKLGV
jgi:DNA ligase-1